MTTRLEGDPARAGSARSEPGARTSAQAAVADNDAATTEAKTQTLLVTAGTLPTYRLGRSLDRHLSSESTHRSPRARSGRHARPHSGAHHAPWDYLGGVLACREAGARVQEAGHLPLEVVEFNARRQLIAGATDDLFRALSASAGV